MVNPSRPTIVLAEDDPVTRMLLCRILERENFHVIAVEDGRLACDAVRREHPDLVLLDWAMPIMDGPTALDVLKADAGTRSIPVMMLTSHGDTDEKVLALTAGVQDYVTKPVNPRELVARITQQLTWRKLVARDAERKNESERLRHYGAPKINSNLAKSGSAQESSYIETLFGTSKKRW